MLLYPPLNKDKALAFLTDQATVLWGADVAKDMKVQLETFAEAMAAVSAANVPVEVEPLYFPYSGAAKAAGMAS